MSKTERLFQPQLNEDRLEKRIGDTSLTPLEQRGLWAADSLPISLKEREAIFVTFIYRQSGVFRVKDLLDIIPQRTVDMRDKVVVDPKFEEPVAKFEMLMRPYFAEVAHYKSEKMTHREIAESLGISVGDVDRISGLLVDARLIEPSSKGKGQSVRFNNGLGELLAQRGRATTAQIAEQTGRSQASISGAFKRMTRVNRIGHIDRRVLAEYDPQYAQHREIRAAVLKYQLESPSVSANQLAMILTEELGYSVSIHQIKRQRRMLYEKKLLEKKNQFDSSSRPK